ncbi:MAG: cysteine synthase A [Spirochaetia bacterium]
MNIKDSIVDLIGGTPLIRIQKAKWGIEADILLKMESHNPLSSVKDRIGLSMVEAAEKQGKLMQGGTIIEPTSGNTGIALAYIGAVKGYKVILTMPDTMSLERRKLLKAFGAELVLTPGEKGMKGAIDKAKELASEIEHAFIPGQFDNPANPDIHERTTAEEIWKDTDGDVDIFVAGVGTGGSFTGISTRLKKYNPELTAYAVEPEDSAVISGGDPGPHKIQGIGAGFVPENLHTDLIDGIIKMSAEKAANTARELAKKDGILGGISAGSNLAAALELARKPENKEKTIVTILCDTGERYLSTWLWDFE